jgi:outer membrane lipoprotein SlyB
MILRLLLSLAFASLSLFADVIVLQDGSSYTGHLRTSAGTISFKGENGVGFTFPTRDVQSLAFTSAKDTITLRSGRTYTGRYTGDATLGFSGAEGISYDFPIRDVASVVFTAGRAMHESQQSEPARRTENAQAEVIPEGTEISITSNERIDSDKARGGELYSATIASDVSDSRGGIAIPNGSKAKLVVNNSSTGGAVHTPELVLDLYSVDVAGKQYRVVSSNVIEKGRESVGANKRTAEFAGGGAGIGALLGGIFGGGEGAGIGAAAGAGGGALTQLFTRGKHVKVPAETTMIFRLERTLVLHP